MGLDPERFAAAWIRDWNAHDLEAILGHYAEDVVFRSPKILIFTEGRTDRLDGREALRPYFTRGLANRPNLTFGTPRIFKDASGVALVYKAEDGNTACETMRLDADGLVVEVRAFYENEIKWP